VKRHGKRQANVQGEATPMT